MRPHPNLHERTAYIILDESLLHIAKNVLSEYGGGITILGLKLEIHSLLENAKKTMAEELKNICDVRCERDNLD
jgi:hypothetical protein